MQHQIAISPISPQYHKAVINLLQSEKLPVADLPPGLPNFIVATVNGAVAGATGLEIYEDNGLLRSLVVRPEFRKMEIASALVNELESLCRNLRLNTIYLLTETAQDYFSRKEYSIVDRKEAPASLQQSSEFRYACPSSAILMKKKL